MVFHMQMEKLEIDMKKLFLFIIKFYRKYISPMKSTKCPYIPSCSEYGMEAIEKYGALKGGALALWRIIRCNPFSKGGYDPVPSMKAKASTKTSVKTKKEKNVKTFYRL